jgi:CRP/FNR family cyclic AMP-dependent transcriptional regulator
MMAGVNPVERLQRLAAFSHLSAEHLAQLARCTSFSRFPKGVTVVKEGDSTTDAYVIDSGSVRIQRETPYGKYPLATLTAGEIFGETSFVDQGARSSDATTLEKSEFLVLNPLALSTVTDRDQRFTVALYWAFWKSLSRKLRATNETLAKFFSEGGLAPALPPPRRDATGEFRVGVDTKRSLFEEQRLSSMEIRFLSTLSREKKLKSGEVLFREGEPGDAMYVVLEGRVMISKHIPGAGEEALAFMERGDWFGEMALIDNQPRSAEATAHDEGAVVLAIPSDVVAGLLDIRKVSSLRLLRILCQLVAKRLREIDDKLVGWFILAGGS